MDLDVGTNKKIEELQVLEGQLQNFLAQKQNSQIELNEIENALGEVERSEDEVYKVVSGIMLKSNKVDVKEDLNQKKKMIEMRIDSLEKQEKMIEKNSNELKEAINKAMKK